MPEASKGRPRPEGLVYQVYLRSFRDSDGDGIGDLPGVIAGLDHIASLGADVVWLSPIHPSPLADWGYDISDLESIDPVFGTLADLERLCDEAHARGMRVLMDLVCSHTSIEHPWFRDHPERYVRHPGTRAPNNWVASFGGPAWSPDPIHGGLYLHSFYPEQPDLDWRNPEVPAAVAKVIGHWLGRGIDGFRLDAIDRLAKDPGLRDDPPSREPSPLPEHPDAARLDHRHSRNAPDIGEFLAAIREAAGDALLVGEAYLHTGLLGPYLEHLDSAFCFDFLHAGWDPAAVRRALAQGLATPGVGWAMSNHDFPRVPDRLGRGHERAAAILLLTLPGLSFVYQGEEIGMGDGPGASPPLDRFGRDAHRHPVQWAPGPGAGFTAGQPWLPMVDADERNVADQSRDPRSTLALYRELGGLRRELRGPGELVDLGDGVVAFSRGDVLVAANMGERPIDLPAGELLVASSPLGGTRLPPGRAAVLRP